MSNFHSPLRYPGGKNCIFNFVTSLMSENNLVGYSYAEPYAGGSGLALRLLFEEYVNHIYLNDLDKSIYAFWYSILYNTTEFCDWIDKVEVSVSNWNIYKKIQEKEEENLLELGKSTFFLNRTNVSGVIKGGIIGGKAQKSKYKIDARFNKSELIKRIQKIAKNKDRITLSNLDGINFVDELDRKDDDIFIYLDPPYYQKGSKLYMNFYTEQDHERLSLYVQRLNKNWMMSYDNHDFILNLYGEQNKLIYKLPHSTSNSIGDEILIFKDGIEFEKSQNNLKSAISI